MASDKVSVIIPAYNREEYIRQTIESVLNQTYENISLSVVDDGSTDSTREILETYRDRISILEHPGRVNKGQSACINLALRQADGKYIAILDSDDFWELDKIESQVSFLEEHPDIGLVYGNGTAVNEKGEYLYDLYPDNHIEENKPDNVLMDCYFLLPNNSLVRSEVMQQAGFFDETLRSAQDHDMAIRVAEITNLAYLDKILFHYRRHANSISNNRADLRWRNGFLILNKAIERYDYSARVVAKRKAVLHFRIAQCFLERKNFLSAAPHLLLTLAYDPLRTFRVLLGKEAISSPH